MQNIKENDRKNQTVPDEVLSKEFLSQFKAEADVSQFLKQLHAQVLEKMLEGEMDVHLETVLNLWFDPIKHNLYHC